jgi:hypothetical protein
MKQARHVPHARSNPTIVGSFSRFPGFVFTDSGLAPAPVGSFSSFAMRISSLPSDRAGTVRRTMLGGLGAADVPVLPALRMGDRPEPDRSGPVKQSTELSMSLRNNRPY